MLSVSPSLKRQALGAVVEALFGAILIDSGFDLAAVRKVYEERFRPFTDRYCLGPSDHSLHPKSALLELLSSRHCTRWDMKQLEGHGQADRFSTTGEQGGSRRKNRLTRQSVSMASSTGQLEPKRPA